MRKTFFDHEDYTPRSLCSVAAAILGAGALGAGATIYGANRAASAQTKAQQAAIAAQQQQFGIAQNALTPFITGGTNALSSLTKFTDPNDASSPLAAILKLVMPGANMTDTLSQTPGYQFTEDKGLRAVNNALAARGLGGSPGAVAKGAADYTTGLANNTWQSVVQNLLAAFQGGSGALQGIVNTGANAGGNLAGGAITTGGQIANSLTGIGNAQAGAATATGNAVAGFGNTASTAAILQKLLGQSGGGNAPSGSVYGQQFGNDGDVWKPAPYEIG